MTGLMTSNKIWDPRFQMLKMYCGNLHISSMDLDRKLDTKSLQEILGSCSCNLSVEVVFVSLLLV